MVATVSNNEYAETLARAHFELEPGITTIAQLVSGSDELPNEPLKMLEVNENTLSLGVRPISFPARVEGTAWYPPVVIIEVTPDEYKRIEAGSLSLPNGWRVSRIFNRSA